MPTDILFGGMQLGAWEPPSTTSGDMDSWRVRARHMHDLGVVRHARPVDLLRDRSRAPNDIRNGRFCRK
jgi:hypothetical protein